MRNKPFLILLFMLCMIKSNAQIGFKNFHIDPNLTITIKAEFGCMTDLNNDGLLDLVCLAKHDPNNLGYPEGRFFLTYLQNQDTFSVADTFWLEDRFYFAQAMYSDDFIGDNQPEFVVAYAQHLELFQYTSSGEFLLIDSIHFNADVIDMQITDLLDDDTVRIIVTTSDDFNPGKLHIVTPRVNGALHQWSTEALTFTNDRFSIGIGDFNNDGLNDITTFAYSTTNQISGLAIWYGTSTWVQAQFSFYPHQQLAPMGQSLATGDFNSDGLDDIAVSCATNQIDNYFVAWFQDSIGNFNQQLFLGEGMTYFDDMVSGHFSCADKDDIIHLAHFGFNIGYSCFEQIGTGFLWNLSPPTGPFLNSTKAGRQVVDVNNDGLDDILRVGNQVIGIEFNISDQLSRIDTLSTTQYFDSIYVQLDSFSDTSIQSITVDTIDTLVITKTRYFQKTTFTSDTTKYSFIQEIIQTKSCLIYTFDTSQYVETSTSTGFFWTTSQWLDLDTVIIPASIEIPIDSNDTIDQTDSTKTIIPFKLSIYPNPTNGILNFVWNNISPSEFVVEIDNALGQIVHWAISPSSIQIAHLPAGTYVVRVSPFGIRQKIIKL